MGVAGARLHPNVHVGQHPTVQVARRCCNYRLSPLFQRPVVHFARSVMININIITPGQQCTSMCPGIYLGRGRSRRLPLRREAPVASPAGVALSQPPWWGAPGGGGIESCFDPIEYCILYIKTYGDLRGTHLLYRRGVPLVNDPGRVPVFAGQLRGESQLGAIPFAPPPWVPVASPRQRVCRLDAVLPIQHI